MQRGQERVRVPVPAEQDQQDARVEMELGERAKELLNSPSPDCTKCIHRPICQVYKAIDPLIQGAFTKDDRPFETQELAKICKHYDVKPK